MKQPAFGLSPQEGNPQDPISSVDERTLAHFGKRQRFKVNTLEVIHPVITLAILMFRKRNFSLISIIGLDCTLSTKS